MQQHAKIGMIDSGVGGLSVLLEIRNRLPNASLHYIGDSNWCPYGNKSPEQITERIIALSELLIKTGTHIIVIACNSATIHAVASAREKFSIPIVGMEPAVKPAAAATVSGIIGVLATEASIAGEKFHHLLDTHAPPSKIKVITQPCPLFVELVEAGSLSGDEVTDAIRKYTTPMLEAGADTLVLGCTHYHFLRGSIQQVVGNNITLIDTGIAVAKRTQSLLADLKIQPSASSAPTLHIQTTGSLETLKSIFPILCPHLSDSASFSQLTQLTPS